MANRRLSIEEVKNKRFTPVRFREGYEQDDVDDFMDELEVTVESFEHELSVLKKERENFLRDRDRSNPAAQIQEANLPMVGIAQEILDAEVRLREETKAKLDETEEARVEVDKLRIKAEFGFTKLEKIHRETVAEKETLVKDKEFLENKIKNLDKELKEAKAVAGGSKTDTAELAKLKKSHERELTKINKRLTEAEEERKVLEDQNQELLNHLFELQSGALTTRPGDENAQSKTSGGDEASKVEKTSTPIVNESPVGNEVDADAPHSNDTDSLDGEASLVEDTSKTVSAVEEELALARESAESILEAARVQADEIVKNAHDDLKNSVKNLVSEQEFLETEVARLRSLESQARQELRAHYTKKLAEIDGRHTNDDKYAVKEPRGKTGLPAGRRRLETKTKSVDIDEALPNPVSE